jgi:hypothetical protein
MRNTLRCALAIFAIVVAGAIAPAIAQFPPGPDDSHDPAAAAPKGKKAAAANGPNVTGAWIGQLTQIGSETPYKLDLMLSGQGGETRYPELQCTGKLTRIGASKSYVFFVEVITKGQSEKGGRCPDGTITLTRHGDNVALGWFGAFESKPIVAYGTLTKK